MDWVGKRIDRYQVIEMQGEGGMATVYRAHDTRLERDVAIKAIRSEEFPPKLLENIRKRFEREAKTLARLSHPNIVSVHDYGEHEGTPYLVMAYIPGGTLRERLGQPMPWRETLQLLLPIAQALDYAHQQGVLHRDVKPSNILITPSGTPVLSDFGIAKLLEDDSGATLTSTGMGIGTPEYMAPEQFLTSATASNVADPEATRLHEGVGGAYKPTLDGRTDEYSLGVVLYELITGHKPYTADTPFGVVVKQSTEPLILPHKYIADLPEAVEQFIMKTLSRKREFRFPTLGDLAKAAQDLLSQVHERTSMPKKEKKVVEGQTAKEKSLKNVSKQAANHPAKDEKDIVVVVDGIKKKGLGCGAITIILAVFIMLIGILGSLIYWTMLLIFGLPGAFILIAGIVELRKEKEASETKKDDIS